MKSFAQYILIGIAAINTVSANDGLVCEDNFDVTLSEILNTFRSEGSDATSNNLCTMLSTANTEVTQSGTWNSADGHTIEPYELPTDGTSTPNADYAAFANASTACADYVPGTAAALEWREGLALAGDYLISDSGSTGTYTSGGENGNDRVNMYGELSGTLEEQVWKLTVSGGMQPTDVAIALFVNEGDDARTFREALMNPDYTVFGGSHSCDDSNTCTYDYYLAKGFTNDPDVAVCGVDRYFGGGFCDPSADEIAAFNVINAAREDAYADAFYNSRMTSLENSITVSAVTGIGEASFDFDGTGNNQDRTFVEGVDAITSLASAQVGGQEPLRWSPGLYLAAGDQTEYLKSQDEISTVGSGDSTTSDRVGEYGIGGASELQMAGNNDAEMAALLLLIDDGVTGQTNREALLNDNYDSIGVSFSESDNFTYLLDVLVSGDYVTSDDYATCTEHVPGEEPKGALAGVATSVLAFGILAASLV